MNWLEVSFQLDGELAEAVAEVLARYAPSGVVTEHGIKFMDADDPGTPSDDVTVRAYLPADDRLEETRQRLEQSLSYLGMIQAIPAPTYTPIKDANWMESWKQHYRPLTVGEKLIIVPAWMDSPDETRIPIKIDPGMAFGTGTHPTTQLVLDFMEDVIEEMRELGIGNRESGNPSATPNAQFTMIDVGCGSGILSIGALKLGVDKVLGVDVDAASVESSRENADVNGIGEEFIIGQGSVDEVLAGNFEFKSAPLVVANILAPVLIRLMEAGMGTLVAPNGRLILSGILEEKEADIRATAEKNQLEILERRQMGDWVAFTLKTEY